MSKHTTHYRGRSDRSRTWKRLIRRFVLVGTLLSGASTLPVADGEEPGLIHPVNLAGDAAQSISATSHRRTVLKAALQPAAPPTPTESLPTLSPAPPIQLSPLSQTTTRIDAPPGELPQNHAYHTGEQPVASLGMAGDPIQTSAPFYSTPRTPHFTHRPLYFEQRATERNGQSWGALQPVVSGAQFFGTLPVLAYKAGAEPPPMRVHTGNGINPPSDRYTLRQHVRGAVAEAGAVLGLIYILP